MMARQEMLIRRRVLKREARYLSLSELRLDLSDDGQTFALSLYREHYAEHDAHWSERRYQIPVILLTQWVRANGLLIEQRQGGHEAPEEAPLVALGRSSFPVGEWCICATENSDQR